MAAMDRSHACRRDKLHLWGTAGFIQGLHARGGAAIEKDDEILGELCENGVRSLINLIFFYIIFIPNFQINVKILHMHVCIDWNKI